MKRAFDIFALKGKQSDALNKGVNKDAGLPAIESAPKRVKKFELTDAQKQRQDLFREVVSFGEKGLEGEAAEAANYRWKQKLGIPTKKVGMNYPDLKKKLLERENKEVSERVKREQDGMPIYTRAPVIAHKKPMKKKRKLDQSQVATLQVMPGKYKFGSVHLEKRDISRIYADVAKKAPKKKFKKKDDKKNKKRGK